MDEKPKTSPAPKTTKTPSEKVSPPVTTDAEKISVEIVTDPHKRLSAKELREMVATRRAEILAQAIADADLADYQAEQAAKNHSQKPTAPRPEARAELAAVPAEMRRLVWTQTALEQEWDAVSADLKQRIQNTAHAGGVGNQLHALHSIDSSGCLKELAVIDLFLRVVRSWPETAAAVAIVDPLVWEVADLDAAEVERNRRITEATAELDRITATARAAAELAIVVSPEVAEAQRRLFDLQFPASI
jgi:hypothetical protein